MDGQRTKPMVDGMFTRHVDYKHGKVKLSDDEKRSCQVEQHLRVEYKNQARRNGLQILSARLV